VPAHRRAPSAERSARRCAEGVHPRHRPGFAGARLNSDMALLDQIGPVMVGPSSSHTAGACRIALLARHALGARPELARITLHGSFAKTAKGHGTDLALAGGLLGYFPDDPRIRDAFTHATAAGLS